MAIYSEENARLVLDRITEKPSVTGAAAVVGGSSKLIWLWVKESADAKAAMGRGEISESKYLIRGWPDADGDPMWFHDAVGLARKLHALNLDADTRETLSRGYKRLVLRDNGQPAYEVDDHAIAIWGDDKESAETIGGCFDYPYLHDERGARIRMYVYDPTPAALKIHGLRALIPGVYDLVDKRETNTTVNGHVLVLGGNEPKPTPLRRDLETRLAEIRANGPAHQRPDSPVAKFNSDDRVLEPIESRPDNPPRPPALPPPAPKTVAEREREHPRAYTAPAPEPAKPSAPPAPAYARPKQQAADHSGIGRGEVLPGGMKMA